MTAHRRTQARAGADRWSLFLRQRQLANQLRRLQNDFKNCHCPPGCQGGPHNSFTTIPTSLPQRDIRGPYVPIGGVFPKTSLRPEVRNNPECKVLAEARGTSDILLRRNKTRATLRMSLQVHPDPDQPGRRGYYAEMFLTQPRHEEKFIGFIHSWHIDRSTREWEALYLDKGGWGDNADFTFMRMFIRESYGYNTSEDIDRDQAGNVLPAASVRKHFGARWAGLTDGTDIIWMPIIWVHGNVCTLISNRQNLPVPFMATLSEPLPIIVWKRCSNSFGSKVFRKSNSRPGP
jgi:hypothetical protein